MDINRITRAEAGIVHARVERPLGDLRVRPVSTRWTLRNFLQHRYREIPHAPIKFLGGLVRVIPMHARLSGQVYQGPDRATLAPWQVEALDQLLGKNFPVEALPAIFGGRVFDYGVLSQRLITTAGVNFLVDAFQNTTEVENFKFHGFGVGTTAEAIGDTALVTEETTQYVTDNTRPTGTQGEGASANIYRTVGTYSPDSGGTRAITEHGIFSQAPTGGGTLWDRSVFSAVNLVAGSDSLQVTHETTFPAGG